MAYASVFSALERAQFSSFLPWQIELSSLRYFKEVRRGSYQRVSRLGLAGGALN